MKRVLKQLTLVILMPFHVFARVIGIARPGVAVLMYHSVGPGGWEFSVPDSVFVHQLDMLKRRGFRFITLSDMKGILDGRVVMPRRCALLTFDDGYRDILHGAIPVMKQRNVRPVLFVHTNRENTVLGNALPLLSWGELRSMSEDADIGDHSYAHPVLRQLDSDDLEAELRNSGDVILRELGRRAETFAYPGGKYDEKVIRALRTHGFATAFTITPGLVRAGDDPLRLHRIGITSRTTDFELYAHAIGVGEWYGNIVNAVKKLFGIR